MTTVVASPQPILSRPLLLMMVASAGSSAGMWLLFSVIPLYAAGAGGGATGAGLTTGVMMLATVVVELVVPWLLARFGYRAVFGAGIALLGVPALALAASDEIAVILAVCLLRGAGLGIIVVVGTALAAELTPESRRGEGLGLYGIVVGLPAVSGLPVGLWLTDLLGFTPVFLIAATLGLVILPAVLGVPATRTPAADRGGRVVLTGLIRPTLIFATTTFAVGVMITFVPLAVPAASLGLASLAMLAQSVATTLARWWAGRIGDRHGPYRLLVPGVVLAGVGMMGFVWISNPVALIAGAALFGVGFGITQNVTLAIMFSRVPRGSYGKVSVLWNVAYDAGMGAGGVGIGFAVGVLGYPVGFAVTAALIFAAWLLAHRDRATS